MDPIVFGRLGAAAASLVTVLGVTRTYLNKSVTKPSTPKAALSTVAEEDSDCVIVDKKIVRGSSMFESLHTLFNTVEDIQPSLRLLSLLLAGTVVVRCSGELVLLKMEPDAKTSTKLSLLIILGVPVMVAAQLVGLLQGKLSGQIRTSLTQTLMKNLVFSPHNLCHPEELVDADRMGALLADVSQTSQLAVQLGVDRFRRWLDVILVFLTFRDKSPLIMALYVFATVSLVSGQKRMGVYWSKQIADRESALKKQLARFPRHRDTIAVLHGGDAEAATVAGLVAKVEAAKSIKDRFEFWNGLLALLLSRVGGTALALFLNRKSEGLQFVWKTKLLTQLAHSVSCLTSDQGDDSRLASMVRRLHASLIELPKQLPSEAVPFRALTRKANLCVSDVTVLSPTDGTSVLFQSLSFELAPGGALLVSSVSPVSCSALVRIVAGTWPAVMGEVSRPKAGVACVTAKPYLLMDASLKQQITYPDTYSAANESALNAAIQVARISHLFLEQSSSSTSVLSSEDQQKLMIARLIYHRPKFALLDDCWRGIELDHLRQILIYLRNELGAGVLVACSNAAPLKSAEFGFPFDLELVLAAPGKQPPRHQLLITPS